VAVPPFWLRAFSASVEAVVQHRPARPATPTYVGGVMLDAAHALNPAGQHNVGGTGLHSHSRSNDRLQAAPTAPIDLNAGDVFGQPGVQGYPAADARHFGVRIRLREAHVVYMFGVDARVLHDGFDDRGGKVFDWHGAQRLTVSADGGT
jgi:hypothetical protein